MSEELKPHPHAKTMARYARDAAETDTPWERWQVSSRYTNTWSDLSANPRWELEHLYRRKTGFTVHEAQYREDSPVKYTLREHGAHLATFADRNWAERVALLLTAHGGPAHDDA